MTSDQSMRFRLGVFFIGSIILFAFLIVLFGEIPNFLRNQITYQVKLASAPGLVEGTPVRKSGIRIGDVTSVDLNPDTGEVMVTFVVQKKYQLRKSDQMTLGRGIVLGETSVNFATQLDADRTLAPEGFVFSGRIPEGLEKALGDARDLIPASREALEEIKAFAKKMNDFYPELRKTNSELQVTLNNVGRAAEGIDNVLRSNQDRIAKTMDNLSNVATRLADVLNADTQKKLTRLIENLATVSEQLPGYFSEENRLNLTATLKNLNQGTDKFNALLNEENRKNFAAAVKQVANFSERLAGLLNDENQKQFVAVLQNLKKASDQAEDLMKNLNATATETRTNIKTVTNRIESVGKEMEEAVKDSRQIIKRVGTSAERFDEAMVNIRDLTKMLNERAPSVLQNVEEASIRINGIAVNLSEFTKALASGDGTIRRLISDPALFNHLNDAARSASGSLGRFDRIVRDLEVFADKIARHPELLGVRGTVAPSSGIK